MICHLCKNRNIRKLKTVKGIVIYKCGDCDLGFVDQNKTKKLSASHLYKFSEYKKVENKFKMRFRKLVNTIYKFKKKGEVLDVGGGFGLFSSILQKKGKFNIDVIDPEFQPRYFKKPINYQKVSLENFLKANSKEYDMIILMDVVEHFRDPMENLKKIKTKLKKNGMLVIQTPNYKSLMARLCKEWSWWMVEDHKFFFSPSSMNLLLQRSGYRVKHFTTYEDFVDFKKNLDGNFIGIKNNFIRRTLKAIFFSVFIPLYFLFKNLIWALGKGGLIYLVAEINPAV